jgi:quinoprotein glucose dehydrogenase
VPLGEYPELAAQGIVNTGSENYGGAIVTAGGLLFCSGTRDPNLRAFDKDTGTELWAGKLPYTGIAPPATYEIKGRQYVVITATGNKLGKQSQYGDAWVAFALPGPQGK